MREPIVFVVDEDPRALAAPTAALQRRFGADYQIVGDGDRRRRSAPSSS
jgi:hypothetical protein